MIYSIELWAIKNNVITGGYKTYDFKSDIKGLVTFSAQLVTEAIDKYKDKFDDYDVIAIKQLGHACDILKMDYQDKIPEEFKQIFEDSKKEVEEYANSKEGKTELLKTAMANEIRNLNNIRKDAENLDMLDSKEFLDYQDALNKLSIDPDRK